MTDLSEFTRLAQPKRPPCKVAAALAKLEPADREKVEAALAAVDEVTPGAITLWLEAKGVEDAPRYGFVKSHRKGTCRCGDD
jgi:hypothetical protein